MEQENPSKPYINAQPPCGADNSHSIRHSSFGSLRRHARPTPKSSFKHNSDGSDGAEGSTDRQSSVQKHGREKRQPKLSRPFMCHMDLHVWHDACIIIFLCPWLTGEGGCQERERGRLDLLLDP